MKITTSLTTAQARPASWSGRLHSWLDIRYLALLTSAATYALIVLGGAVRTTDSGLACPDWPRCHGQLIPPLETSVLIEYSHRLAAVSVGLLIFGTMATTWLWHRHDRLLLASATGAFLVLIIQVLVGGVTVNMELPESIVALHLTIALILLAMLLFTTVGAFRQRQQWSGMNGQLTVLSKRPYSGPGQRWSPFLTVITLAALATLALIITGSYVANSGASLVYPDWPLFDGKFVSAGGRLADLHYVHRLMAALVGLLILVVAFSGLVEGAPGIAPVSGRVGRYPLRSPGLCGCQQHLANPRHLGSHSPFGSGFSSMGSAGLWRLVELLATSDCVGRFTVLVSVTARRARGLGELAWAYVRLTKPRIISLLLITTVPAMILAEKGWPSAWLILATLTGGALAAGGANAMNCYFDRDIDSVMLRTRNRPIPAGQIEPERAAAFGIALGAIGFLILQTFVNSLAAFLTLGAFAFYVVVYTLLLKRTTPQNIVIGGAAGAAPPVVGWAAVTGQVELPALVLFAIIVFWTPPHFWALALNYSSDYERARIPMLPVTLGQEETKRYIFWYSLVLVAVSLLLFPLGATGLLYLSAALVLGGLFIGYALRLWRDASARCSATLFGYSIIYLALLFIFIAADRLTRN